MNYIERINKMCSLKQFKQHLKNKEYKWTTKNNFIIIDFNNKLWKFEREGNFIGFIIN